MIEISNFFIFFILIIDVYLLSYSEILKDYQLTVSNFKKQRFCSDWGRRILFLLGFMLLLMHRDSFSSVFIVVVALLYGIVEIKIIQSQKKGDPVYLKIYQETEPKIIHHERYQDIIKNKSYRPLSDLKAYKNKQLEEIILVSQILNNNEIIACNPAGISCEVLEDGNLEITYIGFIYEIKLNGTHEGFNVDRGLPARKYPFKCLGFIDVQIDGEKKEYL